MPFINSVRATFGAQGRMGQRRLSAATGGTITNSSGNITAPGQGADGVIFIEYC
jgi:hypothetical protein